MTLKDKFNLLANLFGSINTSRVAVAFSGGVDSSLLLRLSKDFLNDVTAIFMSSVLVDEEDIFNAVVVSDEIGVDLKIIHWDPLKVDEIAMNTQMRCYYCKREIYRIIKDYCDSQNINIILDGTNYDDLKKGYQGRPGLRALDELDIKKPLADCLFTKEDVREMAKLLGLSNHQRPSKSCKATRLPYDMRLPF